jgi:hypothetical protein
MPQVTVYRDILSDDQIELLLNEIRISQKNYQEMEKTDPSLSTYYDFHGPQPQNRDDGTLIMTWTPWYTYGLRSVWSNPYDIKNKKEHISGYNIIKNAIAEAHFDYLSDYKDSGRWTYDIKEWDILAPEDEEGNNMPLSTFEILQHRLNLDQDYTIGVHTDWHNHRLDEPGPKQILTYTIYLNDDYEGGEIDFVDEENNKLIVYKPKKGDITIFPSGQPYWHGARAVKSEPSKIFIRTFGIYRHPGSKEWNTGLKLHGIKNWIDKENERVKDFADKGNVGRQIVFEGESPNIGNNLLPLYIKSEEYIDGRGV